MKTIVRNDAYYMNILDWLLKNKEESTGIERSVALEEMANTNVQLSKYGEKYNSIFHTSLRLDDMDLSL